VPPFDSRDRERTRAEIDTLEKAITFLRSSTDVLCSAIEACPDERLSETVQFGPMTKTLADVMLFVHVHSGYHFGQINYIQTLYGDQQMHF
jgi:uncharacterized damage-inducible protein DinB